MEGNGETAKDVGNERGGSAEGFRDDGTALEEDIVAVITNNENALNWVVLGLRGGGYHGGEGEKRRTFLLLDFGSWR